MKTFYTVKYFDNWTGTATDKWFDSREKAMAFYEKSEASDKPVAHVLRNPERIEKITEMIRETEMREEYEKDLGRGKWVVYWVGGKRDGEILATFDTGEKNPDFRAEKFAEKFYEEHKDEFDPVCGGVGIMEPDGSVHERG